MVVPIYRCRTPCRKRIILYPVCLKEFYIFNNLSDETEKNASPKLAI